MKTMRIFALTAALLLGPAVMSHAQTTLRVAGLTSISKAPPLIVAEAKGYYERAGIKVEQRLFAEGRIAIEGLASGKFDIGMFGDIPAFSLLGQGFPGKVIAAGLGGPAREVFMVKDAAYKNIRDLKGKKIGITKGSTNELLFNAVLKREGLTPADFNVVNLKHEDKPQALQLGQVDAVVIWEPGPAIITVKGIGRKLMSSDDYVDDNVGVLVASNDILKRDPQAVIRFLRALNAASAYAQSHPNEMVDLLSQQLKLDRDVLVHAIPTQWWYIEIFADTVANWQQTVDLLTALKRSDKPLQLAQVMDFTYLSKALDKSYPLKQKAKEVMKYPVVTVAR